MRQCFPSKLRALLAAVLVLALLTPGCKKTDDERTVKMEGAKAKAKTDEEKTKAIREVLLAQTLRPKFVMMDGQEGSVAEFTRSKDGVDDPAPAKEEKAAGWKLEELVKYLKEMEQPGKRPVTFEFDGGINVVLDRTNVTVKLAAGGEQMNLKQAKEFADRMLQVVQFGRKLFDLMYRLS